MKVIRQHRLQRPHISGHLIRLSDDVSLDDTSILSVVFFSIFSFHGNITREAISHADNLLLGRNGGGTLDGRGSVLRNTQRHGAAGCAWKTPFSRLLGTSAWHLISRKSYWHFDGRPAGGIWYLRFRRASRRSRGSSRQSERVQWIAWITSEYLIIQFTCRQTGRRFTAISVIVFHSWLPRDLYNRSYQLVEPELRVLLFDFTLGGELCRSEIWRAIRARDVPPRVYFARKNRINSTTVLPINVENVSFSRNTRWLERVIYHNDRYCNLREQRRGGTAINVDYSGIEILFDREDLRNTRFRAM